MLQTTQFKNKSLDESICVDDKMPLPALLFSSNNSTAHAHSEHFEVSHCMDTVT